MLFKDYCIVCGTAFYETDQYSRNYCSKICDIRDRQNTNKLDKQSDYHYRGWTKEDKERFKEMFGR